MSDRELLELAAKAAGLDIVGDVDRMIVQPGHHAGGYIIRNARGGDSCWNPLTDDGDALRLAVKCGINVWRDDDVIWTNGVCLVSAMETELNPYAATRRAIVRAAAEIGRAA